MFHHTINIINVTCSTSTYQGVYLGGEQFDRRKRTYLHIAQKWNGHMSLYGWQDMATVGIVDFYLDAIVVACGIGIMKHP